MSDTTDKCEGTLSGAPGDEALGIVSSQPMALEGKTEVKAPGRTNTSLVIPRLHQIQNEVAELKAGIIGIKGIVKDHELGLLDVMARTHTATHKLHMQIRALTQAKRSEEENRVRLAQTVNDMKGGGFRVLCRVRPLNSNEKRLAALGMGNGAGMINNNSSASMKTRVQLGSGSGGGGSMNMAMGGLSRQTTGRGGISAPSEEGLSGYDGGGGSGGGGTGTLTNTGMTVDFISSQQINMLKPSSISYVDSSPSTTTMATTGAASPSTVSEVSNGLSSQSPSPPSLQSSTSLSISPSPLTAHEGIGHNTTLSEELHADDFTPFYFDRVLTPLSTQANLFSDVSDVITTSLDGFNTCVFAYGQTGSGKTHTMFGPPSDPGLVPRAVQLLYDEASKRYPQIEYKIHATLLEIYNEQIRDLLAPLAANASSSSLLSNTSITPTITTSVTTTNAESKSGDLQLHTSSTSTAPLSVYSGAVFSKTREDGADDDDVLADLLPTGELQPSSDTSSTSSISNNTTTSNNNDTDPSRTLRIRSGRRGMFVAQATRVTCETPEQLIALIHEGASSRAVGSTNLNAASTRSHVILQLSVVGVDVLTMARSFGKVSLVDLAGSERVSVAGSQGQRLVEAGHINKSLSVLGDVFLALEAKSKERERMGKATLRGDAKRKYAAQLAAIHAAAAAAAANGGTVDEATVNSLVADYDNNNNSSSSTNKGREVHVPYRNSKLTYLLQDSIGGNSRTIMIVTISPSPLHHFESHSSLLFAKRVKSVRLDPAIAAVDGALAQRYKLIIDNMKRKVEEAKAQALRMQRALEKKVEEKDQVIAKLNQEKVTKTAAASSAIEMLQKENETLKKQARQTTKEQEREKSKTKAEEKALKDKQSLMEDLQLQNKALQQQLVSMQTDHIKSEVEYKRRIDDLTSKLNQARLQRGGDSSITGDKWQIEAQSLRRKLQKEVTERHNAHKLNKLRAAQLSQLRAIVRELSAELDSRGIPLPLSASGFAAIAASPRLDSIDRMSGVYDNDKNFETMSMISSIGEYTANNNDNNDNISVADDMLGDATDVQSDDGGNGDIVTKRPGTSGHVVSLLQQGKDDQQQKHQLQQQGLPHPRYRRRSGSMASLDASLFSSDSSHQGQGQEQRQQTTGAGGSGTTASSSLNPNPRKERRGSETAILSSSGRRSSTNATNLNTNDMSGNFTSNTPFRDGDSSSSSSSSLTATPATISASPSPQSSIPLSPPSHLTTPKRLTTVTPSTTTSHIQGRSSVALTQAALGSRALQSGIPKSTPQQTTSTTNPNLTTNTSTSSAPLDTKSPAVTSRAVSSITSPPSTAPSHITPIGTSTPGTTTRRPSSQATQDNMAAVLGPSEARQRLREYKAKHANKSNEGAEGGSSISQQGSSLLTSQHASSSSSSSSAYLSSRSSSITTGPASISASSFSTPNAEKGGLAYKSPRPHQTMSSSSSPMSPPMTRAALLSAAAKAANLAKRNLSSPFSPPPHASSASFTPTSSASSSRQNSKAGMIDIRLESAGSGGVGVGEDGVTLGSVQITPLRKPWLGSSNSNTSTSKVSTKKRSNSNSNILTPAITASISVSAMGKNAEKHGDSTNSSSTPTNHSNDSNSPNIHAKSSTFTVPSPPPSPPDHTRPSSRPIPSSSMPLLTETSSAASLVSTTNPETATLSDSSPYDSMAVPPPPTTPLTRPIGGTRRKVGSTDEGSTHPAMTSNGDINEDTKIMGLEAAHILTPPGWTGEPPKYNDDPAEDDEGEEEEEPIRVNVAGQNDDEDASGKHELIPSQTSCETKTDGTISGASPNASSASTTAQSPPGKSGHRSTLGKQARLSSPSSSSSSFSKSPPHPGYSVATLPRGAALQAMLAEAAEAAGIDLLPGANTFPTNTHGNASTSVSHNGSDGDHTTNNNTGSDRNVTLITTQKGSESETVAGTASDTIPTSEGDVEKVVKRERAPSIDNFDMTLDFEIDFD